LSAACLAATRPVSRLRPLLLATCLAFPLVASALEGQQRAAAAGRAERRTPRRVVFAVAGAIVSGAAASAYVFTSEEGRNGFGACSSTGCVASVSLLAGTLVGYMIGREYDELHAIRYRNGAPLSLPNVSAPVEAQALGLAVRDTLVAISGAAGVQLMSSGPRGLRALARRAGGVRGISALDLAPGNGSLAVGSPAGFYVFPPATGPGLLLREGSTEAVVATGSVAYFAVGNRVEVAPLGSDTTRGWPGVEIGLPARALHWDEARRLLWAGTDSTLVALRPDGDSLAIVSSIAIESPARRLDGRENLLVVAQGEAGLRVVDVADPARPVERFHWTTARFVYDAGIVSPTRVLVAGGTDGMYVLDVSGDRAAVVGLARELGFVTTIVVRGGHVYLLDRYEDQLRRIDVSAL
jgi:hypothetical protein